MRNFPVKSGYSVWKSFFPYVSFLLFGLMAFCTGSVMEKPNFTWKEIPAIPPVPGTTVHPGLAGPVTGCSGRFLLIAGGANFKDGLPWKGGVKQYHDEIFLLEKTGSESYTWSRYPSKLPLNLAYSACVSIPAGVVGIGGENESGPVRDVYLYNFHDGKVIVEKLPDLPFGISSGGAAALNSKIYLAGGADSHGATAGFFCLDMNKPGSGWEKLTDLPVPVSHSVVITQNDSSGRCIYVIGGRNKTGEISTFMSSVYKFRPGTGKWIRETDINIDEQVIALAAGTGISSGESSIVLFGGDQGIIFNQTERLNLSMDQSGNPEKQDLLRQKDSLLTSHPGFFRSILVYNTIKKQWSKAGEIPGEAPVTTTAFYWNGTVIIPSGEVRPGIRTPRILAVDIGLSKL